MIKAVKEKNGVMVNTSGVIEDIVDEIAYSAEVIIEDANKSLGADFARMVFADITMRIVNVMKDRTGVDLMDVSDTSNDTEDTAPGFEQKSLDGLAQMILDSMSGHVVDDDGMDDDLPDFWG